MNVSPNELESSIHGWLASVGNGSNDALDLRICGAAGVGKTTALEKVIKILKYFSSSTKVFLCSSIAEADFLLRAYKRSGTDNTSIVVILDEPCEMKLGELSQSFGWVHFAYSALMTSEEMEDVDAREKIPGTIPVFLPHFSSLDYRHRIDLVLHFARKVGLHLSTQAARFVAGRRWHENFTDVQRFLRILNNAFSANRTVLTESIVDNIYQVVRSDLLEGELMSELSRIDFNRYSSLLGSRSVLRWMEASQIVSTLHPIHRQSEFSEGFERTKSLRQTAKELGCPPSTLSCRLRTLKREIDNAVAYNRTCRA